MTGNKVGDNVPERKPNVSRVIGKDEKEAREKAKLLGMTWKKVKVRKKVDGKDVDVEELQRVDHKVRLIGEPKRARDNPVEWIVAWELEG